MTGGTALRLRSLWLAAGWLLVAAVVWLSLVPGPPQPPGGNDKLGHLLAYGLLMGWFAQLYRGAGVRGAYALGFILLGVALEFLQEAGGARRFETADMLADAAGVLLAWALAHGPAANLLVAVERLLPNRSDG